MWHEIPGLSLWTFVVLVNVEMTPPPPRMTEHPTVHNARVDITKRTEYMIFQEWKISLGFLFFIYMYQHEYGPSLYTIGLAKACFQNEKATV